MKSILFFILLLVSFESQAEDSRPEPLSLREEYVGEDVCKEGDIVTTIYLTDEERKEDILTVNSIGVLVDNEGSKFSSMGLKNDLAKFVIDVDGKIYSEYEDSVEY